MDIGLESQGAVQILAPVGRMDTDSSGDVDLAIHDLWQAEARHFVLDLSKVGYISSAGLRVFLSLAKKLEGGVGSLRIAGLNPQIKQVFDISGFTKLFSIFPDRAAAMKDHPNAAAPALDVGKVAAKLMGAAGKKKEGGSAASSVASAAAAALLGAKPAGGGGAAPAPAPAPAAAAPAAPAPKPPAAEPPGMGRPMAPLPPTPAATPEKKPGFWARLFGRK